MRKIAVGLILNDRRLKAVVFLAAESRVEAKADHVANFV
jgi:hypothetical protein